jgi:hypothetical protein
MLLMQMALLNAGCTEECVAAAWRALGSAAADAFVHRQVSYNRVDAVAVHSAGALIPSRKQHHSVHWQLALVDH